MQAAMVYEVSLPWWLPCAVVAAVVFLVTLKVVRVWALNRLRDGAEGRSPLTPDVEAAARERFNPTAKPGDSGAIRPADEGVREEGA